MKIKLIFILLLASFFSCSKQEVLPDDPITFGQCQTDASKDLNICFVSLQDGRCPCNAVCFWEGSVDVGIRILTLSGIDTTVVFTQKQPEKHIAIVDGHTIELKEVLVDFCNDQGVSSKYRIKLDVQ
jgi:hypothetical protein